MTANKDGRSLRSKEGAKIFSMYARGIGKRPLGDLLRELEFAREKALEIATRPEAEADERQEVEKRYLEQKLFTVCEAESTVLDILGAMVAICECDSFDEDRRNHVLRLGMPMLEWRLKE